MYMNGKQETFGDDDDDEDDDDHDYDDHDIYVVVNFFPQVFFSFLLLLWKFSFVLHSLASITQKKANN